MEGGRRSLQGRWRERGGQRDVSVTTKGKWGRRKSGTKHSVTVDGGLLCCTYQMIEENLTLPISSLVPRLSPRPDEK